MAALCSEARGTWPPSSGAVPTESSPQILIPSGATCPDHIMVRNKPRFRPCAVAAGDAHASAACSELRCASCICSNLCSGPHQPVAGSKACKITVDALELTMQSSPACVSAAGKYASSRGVTSLQSSSKAHAYSAASSRHASDIFLICATTNLWPTTVLQEDHLHDDSFHLLLVAHCSASGLAYVVVCGQ